MSHEPFPRAPFSADPGQEQSIDDVLAMRLKGGEVGDRLPDRIEPRALSALLEELPKVEGAQITAVDLHASLARLGYRLIEEDAEEPFYRKD